MSNIPEKNNNYNEEIVSFAYDLKSGGSYVKNVFYELETDKAVMFGRNSDDKVLFIPKLAIKGGWTKDKKKAQHITIRFGIELHWRPRKI